MAKDKQATSASFKSGYIESQAKGVTEQHARETLRLDQQLDLVVEKLSSTGPLPPLNYMQTIGSHDPQHFTSNMKLFSLEILTRCKATPISTILDLGCGCGRLALPICEFLGQTGSYIGVDVWDEGIEWCKENISNVSDKFNFYTLSSENNYYFNDATSEIENSYSLPFIPPSSVDVTFAISLFTHLRYKDALNYLKEIGRTLKPDGAAYITCFIMDHYVFDYVARTGNHTAVRESGTDKECYYAYSHQDFFSGFSMGAWNAMLKEAGLWALCYETGSWAEKPGARMYQDTFVLVKA